MTRVLVGLAMCIGCTFDHGSLGEPGGGYGGSGSGSQQDPHEDTDGDGVVNLVDNCIHVVNADQRDHDDDGRGDACDGCPHLADAGADADGDGVGDACDPRPNQPGDRIAFFEGFYEPVTWKAVIGANTWQPVDGTLRQMNVDTAYQLVRDDTPNLRHVFVDARVRIDGLSTDTGSRRSTGLVLSYRDPSHYFFCGLAAAQGSGALVNAGEVTTDFWGFQQWNFAEKVFPSSMAGEWLTLRARTRPIDGGTQIECESHRGNAVGTAVFDADASANGDVGVRTNGADASFDYVFVVEMPL